MMDAKKYHLKNTSYQLTGIKIISENFNLAGAVFLELIGPSFFFRFKVFFSL